MLKTQDYSAHGLSKSAGKTASNHNKLVLPTLSIRDPRQISSLTTRIGQAHFSGRELVPNEYAKEARGLSMFISIPNLST